MVSLLLFLQLINLYLSISALRNNQSMTDSTLEIERGFRQLNRDFCRIERNLLRRKGKC